LLLADRYRSVEWVDSRGGVIPSNAVPGGHEADGRMLFVARAPHNGDIIPGKV